jgi:hypothetical protein
MRRASLAALTLAAAAGIPAPAQELDETEQATLTATVSQSLVVDSNYGLDDPSPGTSTYGDTRFVLDFLRDTRSRSLGLGIDTGLRALAEAEEDFEFRVATPSRAYLTYLQEGPNTTFDSTFRLRSRQVDFNVFDLDDDIDEVPDDLTVLQGDTRELRADADIGLVVGVDAPSSTEFRLTATNIDYTDAEDASNLTPRYTLAGEALWTLRLTSVFSAALFGSYSYYNADDEENDEIRVAEADAGLVYQPSETLRVRGGLGYADRVREQTLIEDDVRVREETENDSGPTVRGDFRYILPSLTLRGDLRITTAAPQTRVSGNLFGVYNLPRGRVTGRVFQRYGGSQTGSDSRVTGAGVGLVRDLNTLSRIELDASYAIQVDEDDPDEPDIERTDLTASYVYDVTDTVSAELGYGYRHRIEDPDDADSHRVFLVLGKTFETGL